MTGGADWPTEPLPVVSAEPTEVLPVAGELPVPTEPGRHRLGGGSGLTTLGLVLDLAQRASATVRRWWS